MKTFNIRVLSFSVLAFTTAPMSEVSAAQGCPTCGGYFYTQVSQINNGGVTINQFNLAGPYADQTSCTDAVADDQSNNDGWLPYSGAPICYFQFETDYAAYQEIIDIWNTSNPPSGDGGLILLDEQVIRDINMLRDDYDMQTYDKAIKYITDPTIDD